MNRGADLAYHLKPSKAVDRRIFLELLRRYERWLPLEKGAYLSMGGWSMEDHRLLNRVVGIEKLFSFDASQDVVDRQIFNRPVDKCHCKTMTSGQFIKSFDTILDTLGVTDQAPIIAWLDYTRPSDLGAQLSEFRSLLEKLGPGDVARITLNANNEAIRAGDLTGLAADDVRVRRMEAYAEKVGIYAPGDIDPDDFKRSSYSRLLSRTLENVVGDALPSRGDMGFLLLSALEYSDSTSMLTLTGAITAPRTRSSVLERCSFENWVFFSPDYRSVHRIQVPTLSLREKQFMERRAVEGTSDISDDMGFARLGGLSLTDYFEEYRQYYRFYPNFALIDI